MNTDITAQKSIPFDLLHDIFLMLPVKSLLKLKLVSKEWYNFINSFYFIKLHLDRSVSNSNYHLLVSARIIETDDGSTNQPSSYIQFYDIDLKTLLDGSNNQLEFKPLATPEDSCTRLVGSCHGVVCLRDSQTLIELSDTPVHIKTKQDRSGDDHFVEGSGYDPIGDDYKVVKIVEEDHNPRRKKILVYSWRKQRWNYKRVEIGRYFGYFKEQNRGTLSQNRLHWRASLRNYDRRATAIAYFDLCDENFTYTDFLCHYYVTNLVCLQGTIHVTAHRNSETLSVWKMEGYDDGANKVTWSELCHIPKLARYTLPMSFSRKGAELIMYAQPLSQMLRLGLIDTSRGYIEQPPPVELPIPTPLSDSDRYVDCLL